MSHHAHPPSFIVLSYSLSSVVCRTGRQIEEKGGLPPIEVNREVAAELSLVVAGPLKEGGLWPPVRLELVKE